MSYSICVNAGHAPGIDPGACGRYSEEADICRMVGIMLVDELERKGYQAVFVQEDELQDVCDVGNTCDAFISIHCNAAENPAAEGTETFYYEYGDPSYRLAVKVQDALVEALDTTDRGVKDGSWLYVLNNIGKAPTILTELAFISNPEEEDLLNTKIAEIAVALSEGIDAFVKEGC